MSLAGTKTTTSYLEWGKLTGLVAKLERDGQHKFALLISVGAFTGLRIGDVLSLHWADVLDKDDLIVTERKTGNVREIHIAPDLKATIRRLHDKMCVTDNGRPLFLNKHGSKPFRIQYVNAMLKRLFRRYGIEAANVSSHMLRKSFGREIWRRNNHSEEALVKLSELFGHSSVAITRRYLGIRREEIADLYGSLSL